MRWLPLIFALAVAGCSAPADKTGITVITRPSLAVERVWLLDGLDQSQMMWLSAGLRTALPAAFRQCQVSAESEVAPAASWTERPSDAMRRFRPNLVLRLEMADAQASPGRVVLHVRGTVTTFPDGLVALVGWEYDGPPRDGLELGRRLAEGLVYQLAASRLLPGCDLLRYGPLRS